MGSRRWTSALPLIYYGTVEFTDEQRWKKQHIASRLFFHTSDVAAADSSSVACDWLGEVRLQVIDRTIGYRWLAHITLNGSGILLWCSGYDSQKKWGRGIISSVKVFRFLAIWKCNQIIRVKAKRGNDGKSRWAIFRWFPMNHSKFFLFCDETYVRNFFYLHFTMSYVGRLTKSFRNVHWRPSVANCGVR